MAKKIELLEGLAEGSGASIGLFFKNEGSDKEYHVHLKEADGGWVVAFQFGKRGSALRPGMKTPTPLDWQGAAEIYSKTVRGQLKDGYTPNSSGAAYQDTPLGERNSGLVPQLLNSEDEDSFLPKIDDPKWFFQEKFDGERMMVRKLEDGTIQGINKKGLLVPISMEIVEAAQALKAKSFVIDSEWLGKRAAVFDLIELDGKSLAGLGALRRKMVLDELVDGLEGELASVFIHVDTATTPAAKRALYERVRDGGGEGVVGKVVDSPYEAGRPNSGGNQIKRKFVESATLVAGTASRGKRSVEVYAFDGEEKIHLGHVTVPANAEIPEEGKLVEVHYLYANRGGKLQQLTYKGERLDQDLSDATMAQLKYKREDNGPTEAPARKAKM